MAHVNLLSFHILSKIRDATRCKSEAQTLIPTNNDDENSSIPIAIPFKRDLRMEKVLDELENHLAQIKFLSTRLSKRTGLQSDTESSQTEEQLIQMPKRPSIEETNASFQNTDDTTFQRAFLHALHDKVSPAQAVTKTLHANKPQSIPELFAAHNLLVFAIRDNSIPSSTSFNNIPFFWFENLYLSARHCVCQSQEDFQIVRRVCKEAEMTGVIASAEVVLVGFHLRQDIESEMHATRLSTLIMYRSILQVEDRLQALINMFRRYKQMKRYSQLVGVALNLIPSVGGAVAGLTSAGADLLEGYSIKDLVDALFGLGTDLTEQHMENEDFSAGDRMLLAAHKLLSEDNMSTMSAEQKEKLHDLVAACGISVEDLRQELVSRIGRKRNNLMIVEEKSQEGDMPTVENEIRTGNTVEEEQEVVSEVKTIKTYKEFEMNRKSLIDLGSNELGSLWAAQIVQFDVDREEEFLALSTCLSKALKKENISGLAIMGPDEISGDVLRELALEAINGEQSIPLSLGMRSLSKYFIHKVISFR